MSDILIKGLEMPRDCEMCTIRACEAIYKKTHNCLQTLSFMAMLNDIDMGRWEGCPLEEVDETAT